MTIPTTKCNDCGKELKLDEIYTDYDHAIRCRKCNLKNDLYYAKQAYLKLGTWLENTHLKRLAEIKTDIACIKDELKKLTT